MEDGGSRKWRRWALWTLPLGAIVFVLAIDFLAVVATIASLVVGPIRLTDLAGLAWIALLAGIGIELSQRVERLRERHRDTPYKSLHGVWTLAAVLLFPAGTAMLVPLVIYGWIWLRVKRYPGYRWAFSAATSVLSNLCAGLLFTLIAGPASGEGRLTTTRPTLLLGAFVAIATYMLINIVLVGVAIIASVPDAGRRQAFGGRAEHGIELAEACLGLLVAAVYSVTAVLVPFALPVLLLLQRTLLLAQFQSAARRDAKTGLANAQWWHEIAGREVERARRLGEQVSVLIADLDHFKTVNDSYGHIAGDAVLRAVSGEFIAEVREYDVVGRFGGEEFVVVLPGTGIERSYLVAERLRDRVTKLAVEVKRVDGTRSTVENLSVSIGLACFPTHGRDLTDVLRMADAALYGAKDSGRNRVCVGPEGTPHSTPRSLDHRR